MAKARMLSKSISLSRKVNRLKLKSALIYTWGFAHTDDWGLISNDPEVIKATVLPMRKDIRVSDIVAFIEEAQIKDVNGESLITEYQECLEFNAFEDHQTLSPEKRAKAKFSKVPKVIPEIPKNPQESPEKPQIRERKGSEEKGREDNISGVPAAVKDPINILISQFQKVNPNYERLFPNKTQRGATERMLKKLGQEKLSQIIAVLPFSNRDTYGPTITTPLQLETKMGQLMSWYEKKKGRNPEIIKTF